MVTPSLLAIAGEHSANGRYGRDPYQSRSSPVARAAQAPWNTPIAPLTSRPVTRRGGRDAELMIGYEAKGSTVVVTIDRPAVRNAVDQATATALAAAFRRFDGDPDASVAVLTGAGGHFCAGADLKALSSGNGNRVTVDGDAPMGPTRMHLSKPVIAAVEGYAVAGGLELACWCDLRVAASTAIFGVYCRRWGVPLVDGGTIRLPRLVGHGVAMDLILTGRSVGGEEALRIGLLSRVVATGQALDAALTLADEIARFPQLCARSDRLSAYEQWDLDLDGALANETRRGLDVIRSGETRSGADRFARGAGRHGTTEKPK